MSLNTARYLRGLMEGLVISRGSNASNSYHAPQMRPPSKVVQPNGSIDTQHGYTHSTLTKPESTVAPPLKHDTTDTITLSLREAITNAEEHGAHQLRLDCAFAEVIIATLEYRKVQFDELKNRFDGIKVSHYIHFLSDHADHLSSANKQTIHTRPHSCTNGI